MVAHARFSLKSLMVATFLLALGLPPFIRWYREEPPDDAWEAYLGPNVKPLANIPEIVSREEFPRAPNHRDYADYFVTVKNIGSTTLAYRGVKGIGVVWAKQCLESHVVGEWKKTDEVIHCDVGLPRWQKLELPPNEAVKIWVPFRAAESRERSFAIFYEKATNRAGLVLLAEELDHERIRP